ncbi:MAG: ABC transporter ATP-binding protein [Oscillospiraceae bacterium]
MSEVILELQNISKQFGTAEVLKNLSFSVYRGEFLTLLGSSGCGKTTTLRIIAGLETPDTGRILLQGSDVTDTEPNRRDVNTVFQNYALFPHMNVEANIGYSLKLKKEKPQAIQRQVAEMLQLVQLTGYEKRLPSELSGGQQQRVAMARALVNRPQVLLLDEPLGALDLQLRRQMQVELKRLQKHLGITFIYITHDQEEAINMSDRIAVLREGAFEQLGTPAEIYDHPKTSYVATFVGSANIIEGVAEAVQGDVVLVENADGAGKATLWGAKAAPGERVRLAVRSEHISLLPAAEGAEGLPAVVKEKTFAGGMLRIAAETAGGTQLVASRFGMDSALAPGDAVLATWPAENAVLVDGGPANE